MMHTFSLLWERLQITQALHVPVHTVKHYRDEYFDHEKSGTILYCSTSCQNIVSLQFIGGYASREMEETPTKLPSRKEVLSTLGRPLWLRLMSLDTSCANTETMHFMVDKTIDSLAVSCGATMPSLWAEECRTDPLHRFGAKIQFSFRLCQDDTSEEKVSNIERPATEP